MLPMLVEYISDVYEGLLDRIPPPEKPVDAFLSRHEEMQCDILVTLQRNGSHAAPNVTISVNSQGYIKHHL